jgi:hypothetical protein
MSLVHNERLKITANWLNTLAAGIIVTGAVAPVVAGLYGFQGSSRIGSASLVLLSVAWFGIGTGLHLTARWLLTRLRP